VKQQVFFSQTASGGRILICYAAVMEKGNEDPFWALVSDTQQKFVFFFIREGQIFSQYKTPRSWCSLEEEYMYAL
jgi:hypothetical protein